jgi:hypothetical protein
VAEQFGKDPAHRRAGPADLPGRDALHLPPAHGHPLALHSRLLVEASFQFLPGVGPIGDQPFKEGPRLGE